MSICSKVNYKKEAEKRWGKNAFWISGKGAFALVAECRLKDSRFNKTFGYTEDMCTVTLHPTLEMAKLVKNHLDRFTCGGGCFGNHWIEDLRKSPTTNRKRNKNT